MHPHAKNDHQYPGVQQAKHSQQVEGGDPFFLPSPPEAHLKYWVQVRAPQHLGDRNQTEWRKK